MKVAIVGSRGFTNYEVVKTFLNNEKIFEKATKVVSGGARGVDSLAEKYAQENRIAMKIFLADWDTYGKKAGYLRNIDIVEHSDLIIAFWDGKSKGTKITIDLAKKKGKELIIVMERRNDEKDFTADDC